MVLNKLMKLDNTKQKTTLYTYHLAKLLSKYRTFKSYNTWYRTKNLTGTMITYRNV